VLYSNRISASLSSRVTLLIIAVMLAVAVFGFAHLGVSSIHHVLTIPHIQLADGPYPPCTGTILPC
jgi:hypothetical protein